jgi:hypothetical protein
LAGRGRKVRDFSVGEKRTIECFVNFGFQVRPCIIGHKPGNPVFSTSENEICEFLRDNLLSLPDFFYTPAGKAQGISEVAGGNRSC